MADQEITAAKERVNALRRQVRAEQAQRASLNEDASRDHRLAALATEEEELTRQLAQVRATALPGEVEASAQRVVLQSAEVPEGQPFIEVVDSKGNLVRMPVEQPSADEPAEATPDQPSVEATATVAPQAPAAAPEADALDVGTREAEVAPPADTTDDATMGTKPRRR